MRHVKVMGIVNLSPDSFSQDGCPSLKAAQKRVDEVVGEGADILDLGAESTRPGSNPVSLEEEWARMQPVLQWLTQVKLPVPLSIDTRKPEIFRRAVGFGATWANDCSGARDPEWISLLQEYPFVRYVLVHADCNPKTMHLNPQYERGVVSEVREFFATKLAIGEEQGIDRSRVLVDPGVGFAKSTEHTLAVLASLGELKPPGTHMLVGLSRKRFLRDILQKGGLTRTGDEVGHDRLAVATLAAHLGIVDFVDVLRVHDVALTQSALGVWNYLRQEGLKPSHATTSLTGAEGGACPAIA